MIRLLVYANEFESEAFIATVSGTPGELSQFQSEPDGWWRDLPAEAGDFRISNFGFGLWLRAVARVRVDT